MPRHGAGHRFPPHLVPYRANLWALRSLGVTQVVSLSAVGSLRADRPTGTLVVPDQIADRTSGRAHTIFDAADGVGHISFADPYCPRGRAAALGGDEQVVDGGTLVVVNGPRFSSRAESLEFQSHGWSIIGMTAMPEASLARELGLCYTTLALVTDLDAGVEAGEGVTHEAVLAAFAENLPTLRDLLVSTLGRLPGGAGRLRVRRPVRPARPVGRDAEGRSRGPVFSTSIVPPCASTMPRVIASPGRRRPSRRRAAVGRPRRGSRRRTGAAGRSRDAAALVAARVTSAASRSRCDADRDRATVRVCRMALATRLVIARSSCGASPRTRRAARRTDQRDARAGMRRAG